MEIVDRAKEQEHRTFWPEGVAIAMITCAHRQKVETNHVVTIATAGVWKYSLCNSIQRMRGGENSKLFLKKELMR